MNYHNIAILWTWVFGVVSALGFIALIPAVDSHKPVEKTALRVGLTAGAICFVLATLLAGGAL